MPFACENERKLNEELHNAYTFCVLNELFKAFFNFFLNICDYTQDTKQKRTCYADGIIKLIK